MVKRYGVLAPVAGGFGWARGAVPGPLAPVRLRLCAVCAPTPRMAPSRGIEPLLTRIAGLCWHPLPNLAQFRVLSNVIALYNAKVRYDLLMVIYIAMLNSI